MEHLTPKGSASPDEITATVIKIVADHLGLPRPTLSLNDHIETDLGADSFDRLELIMTIEEQFGIKFSEGDINRIQRLRDIVTAVSKILKEGP